MKMFATEQEMSFMFEKYLKANFGNAYLKEYKGLFGIPDFIFYSKQKDDVSIISFELKLKDWKRAAKQAFRYKSFSNNAYVVLPTQSANAAVNNIEMFERYNIGLAKFDSNNYLEILYKPEPSKPYSMNLNQKLVETLSSSRKKSRNINILVR